VLTRDHILLPATHDTFIRIRNESTIHPAFTPQPQSITALWPVLISRFGLAYSIGGWVEQPTQYT